MHDDRTPIPPGHWAFVSQNPDRVPARKPFIPPPDPDAYELLLSLAVDDFERTLASVRKPASH